MNINDIVGKVAPRHQIGRGALKGIIESIVSEISIALQSGEEVSLAGLGKFRIKQKAARTGRNPNTGVAVNIPAGQKVAFTPASALRSMMAKGA